MGEKKTSVNLLACFFSFFHDDPSCTAGWYRVHFQSKHWKYWQAERGPDGLLTVESQCKVIISIWRCERVSRCSFAGSVDSSDPPPPGQKQRRSLLCLTCLCMLLLCSRPWTVRLKERQRCASARRPSASSSCPRWQPATVPSASAAAACSSSPTCSSQVSPRMWTHCARVGVLPQQQQQYFFKPIVESCFLRHGQCGEVSHHTGLKIAVFLVFFLVWFRSFWPQLWCHRLKLWGKKTLSSSTFGVELLRHIWCHNMSTGGPTLYVKINALYLHVTTAVFLLLKTFSPILSFKLYELGLHRKHSKSKAPKTIEKTEQKPFEFVSVSNATIYYRQPR